MKLFQHASLPATCYADEVAHWLALGRVPEFYYDEHGDARNGEEACSSGDLVTNYVPMFSEAEFSWLGVNLDFERYLDAKGTTFDQSGAEHLARGEEFISVLMRNRRTGEESIPEAPKIGPAEISEISERYKQEALDADWAREMEEGFSVHIDVARVAVFQSLAAGKLKATGWLAFSEADPSGDDAGGGRFVEFRQTIGRTAISNGSKMSCGPEPRPFRLCRCRQRKCCEVFPDQHASHVPFVSVYIQASPYRQTRMIIATNLCKSSPGHEASRQKRAVRSGLWCKISSENRNQSE